MSPLNIRPIGFLRQGAHDPKDQGACVPSLLWGKSGLVRSIPIVCHHARGRIFYETVFLPPYLFQHGPFILCYGEAVHLSFRAFSKRNYPYMDIDLVCLWEEVRSGSCYATILNPSSCYLLFFQKYHHHVIASQRYFMIPCYPSLTLKWSTNLVCHSRTFIKMFLWSYGILFFLCVFD